MMKKEYNWKKILIQSLIIIITAAIIGFTVNLFHSRGFRLVNIQTPSISSIVAITPLEAYIKLQGKTIYVDARSQKEFAEGHITGSINIPAHPESVMMEMLSKNFSDINSDRELVIYCNGNDCPSSEELAKKLVSLDYSRHIYIIRDGFPAWQKAKYPVTGGK